MAHMNYYTYTEHQTDDEVKGEIILKKHTLPELPYELICMILYKFGGMESPIVKDMKQLKSKVEYAKQHTQDRFEKGEIEKWKIHSTTFHLFSRDLPLRNIKRFDDTWHDGWVENNRLTTKSFDFILNIFSNLNGEPNKYYYKDRDSHFGSLSKNHMRVIIKEERHLVNMEMTAKEMKEHLDNNGIEYKKSWNKKKLLKVCYSF